MLFYAYPFRACSSVGAERVFYRHEVERSSRSAPTERDGAMGNEEIDGFSTEMIRELRNDFTFFIAMSMLKIMASSTPDAKKFIREVVWKWREKQVQALHIVASEMDKRMFEDKEFSELFGPVMRQVNKTQRGVMIDCIRKFCDTMEEALVASMSSETDGGDGDPLNEEGEGNVPS